MANTELMVGVPAPEFPGLQELRGKMVVLYFYPKDFTPGCTQEACDFRDVHKKAVKKGIVVLGVSKDPAQSHSKFIEKYKLPFELLLDEEGRICEKYGVWREKTLYGRKFMGIIRSTFIIDKSGLVAKIFDKVKVKGHVDEAIAAAESLT